MLLAPLLDPLVECLDLRIQRVDQVQVRLRQRLLLDAQLRPRLLLKPSPPFLSEQLLARELQPLLVREYAAWALGQAGSDWFTKPI